MAFPNIVQAVQNPSSLLAGIFPEPVYIGDLEVDVLSIEDAEKSWSVTEYAIQQNQPIAGARVRNPDAIQLTGWLTDTPPSIAGAISSASNALTSGGTFFQTWQDKKEALEEIADKEQVVKIVTRLDSYPDMMITSIRVSQTKDTARGYPFILTARKARIVSTQFAFVDPSLIPSELADLQTAENVAAQGANTPSANKGPKGTTPAAAEDIDPFRKLARGLGFDV